MRRALLSLSILLIVASLAAADYEYRYLEGEAFSRGESHGVREEGFTSWMGHPSGGKVEVFGRPAGGFLEYDLEGLQEGDYFIHVRCLALPITRTHVLWDGRELGLIQHDGASTALRWSLPLGPVTIPGRAGVPPAKHVLRLQGSDNTTQWPYIDVILLTNAKGYTPPWQDQDFVSYRTPWPLLELKGEKASQFVAPLPPAPSEGLPLEGPAISRPAVPDLNLLALALSTPVLGRNELRLTVSAAKPTGTTFAAVVQPANTPHVAQPGRDIYPLTEDQPQTIALPVSVRAAGPALLYVTAGVGPHPLEGAYPLDIPKIVSVTLDEYAYPTTQRAGRWSAAFTCAPELLPKLSVDLTLKDLQSGKPVLHKTLPVKAPQLDVPFDLVGLPIGRFEADAAFRLDGQLAQSDSRDFIKYAPVAFPAWEPVHTAKAVGDTIVVNGKPFLARMLYHAPMNDEIVSHGFNVVQCYGSDPDPMPNIQKHLDACTQVGLYGTVALFNNQHFNKDTHFDLDRIEAAVVKFKDHPALLCWDLIDEPDGSGMKPAAVQEAADLIRRLDPSRFVWVNLCRNTGASDYLASQDLWSYDTYPFPQLTPFDYKTRWLNTTDRDLLGKLPLGTCLQTYCYNHHTQRMPTPDELRTSLWLHVIHGYKWFGCYSYYDGEPAGCLSRDPVLFSYARALNTEMVQLQDVILAPGQWRDVPIEPVTDKLEAREKEVGGKLYVVVVSDSREAQSATLKPSWANAKRRLLIESEGKAATGPFTVTLRPTAAQVWEVTR
ncbi:MAG: hypothetical protein KKI08_27085 [Armatimonadetes bacterium]|nr:hypothetical protein [Armatimonadota bacterium]